MVSVSDFRPRGRGFELLWCTLEQGTLLCLFQSTHISCKMSTLLGSDRKAVPLWQHSCSAGIWSLHFTACSLLTSLWLVQRLFGQGPDSNQQAAQARLCRPKVEVIAPEVFRTPSRIGGPLRNICVADANRLVSINSFALPLHRTWPWPSWRVSLEKQ